MTDTSQADYTCPAYTDMKTRWQFVRDMRGGTEVLRAARETYLPKFEAEFLLDYNARLAMTFVFEATDETILALTGLATRHDPVLEEDVPPEVVAWWENVDGQRTHGAVFAQHVLEAALQDGHSGILVDYPSVDPALDHVSRLDGGIRPYALPITIDQITAWRIGQVAGKTCVTMVKLKFCEEVPDGAFGCKLIERYRTYRQSADDSGPYVTLEVQEQLKPGEYVVTTPETRIGGTLGPKWIPLFLVYGGKKTGELCSMPPLLGLAYSNLDHTQVKSDRRFSMHKCAIPIPWFTGRTKTQGEGGQLTPSVSYGYDLNDGGACGYMEPTGAALGALREELQDIEHRMGSQGFDLLRREPGTDQTATASRIENTKGESKLARAVRSLEDALEGMTQAFADFGGLKQGGGSVTLQHEFADTILTPDEIRLLMDLEERGELTLETLLGEIQKGGRMLQGVDLEAEVKGIENAMAEEPVMPAPIVGPDGKPIPPMPMVPPVPMAA